MAHPRRLSGFLDVPMSLFLIYREGPVVTKIADIPDSPFLRYREDRPKRDFPISTIRAETKWEYLATAVGLFPPFPLRRSPSQCLGARAHHRILKAFPSPYCHRKSYRGHLVSRDYGPSVCLS